jgi:ATP-dependent helicase/nuclease subunit A
LAHGGPGATIEGTRRWRTEREALIARSARPRQLAATELAQIEGVARRVRLPDRASTTMSEGRDPLAVSARRGASALGRAVHATLETVDLVSGADLSGCAMAAAQVEGCVARVGRVRDLARAALDSTVVKAAVASGRFWRELPIALEVSGTVLEGVVDLCFEEEGELVVVDYKTDALTSENEAVAIAERYRAQAGAYALGLESILGRRLRRFVFVFLAPPDRALEVEVDDLAGAVEVARSRLAGHLSSVGG